MSGAIKTITNMVLISIAPFTHRKILLVVVAFLGLSAFCFADPVLMAQRYSRNPERLDASKTAVSASQQSQQPGKARIARPELYRVESCDQVRDEAEWNSTELWANLSLPMAEPAPSFSLGNVGAGWNLLD
jgi:hypothetical protein